MPILEVKELVYERGRKRILHNLSLSLEAGEVHALLGTNGTGKSTMAYLIMGCSGYQPAAGRILFEGRDVTHLKVHERAQLGIALAWQEPARFEGLSVRDYLSLGRRAPIDPSRCLEMVGLPAEPFLGRMVDRSLSGGERKRIELASIPALRPKLAILDEPDTGIDLLSTQDIIDVIDFLRADGATVFLITHRQEIAMIADRASLICSGKIACTGQPTKVVEFYKSRKCLTCEWTGCLHV
jgi:Fe-S cluster assembly ATP-binding protein